MISPIQVVTKLPAECAASEIQDFLALVRAGGEVVEAGLERRILAAECLVFLGLGCCLSGIAALKRPSSDHREEVSAASGIDLSDFPFELGWIFIMPYARGRRFSKDLVKAALAHVPQSGVFATSRANNIRMHQTLRGQHFVEVGKSWESARGNYKLKLFIKNPAKAAPTL